MKIEMVCKRTKGAAGGLVWYFLCPITGIHCRKLHFVNGQYCHRSLIKNYYREIKPSWLTGGPMDKILLLKKKAIIAERTLGKKYFRSHYNGKPTKKYIECLRDIEKAEGITMHDIVNGTYDCLLKN